MEEVLAWSRKQPSNTVRLIIFLTGSEINSFNETSILGGMVSIPIGLLVLTVSFVGASTPLAEVNSKENLA